MSAQDIPLVCVVDAIPEEERAAHFALLSDLFSIHAQERKDLLRGYAFRFTPDTFERIAEFVARERKCCPFLTFNIVIAPADGPVWLEMSAPKGPVNSSPTDCQPFRLAPEWPNGCAPPAACPGTLGLLRSRP
jgi:hypothetical protein